MTMTVLELREYVRDHLDSDSQELPDSLLDVWRQEATSRIELGSQRWSFFETEVTFSTTVNDQTYALSALTTTVGTTAAALDTVLAVEGPNWVLDPLPHEQARQQFSATDYSGRPRWFSLFNGTIYLWPVPSVVESFLVRGYRAPVPATASSDSPDLPAVFHALVGQWMLARAYQQVDDEGMAAQFFGSFEGQLDILRRRFESPQRAGVSVMGGKSRGPVTVPSGRLLYDFE